MAAEMLELDVDVHHAGMGRDRDGVQSFWLPGSRKQIFRQLKKL
jgi:hypothetical protein